MNWGNEVVAVGLGFVAILVIGPIAEELFWRGLALPAIEAAGGSLAGIGWTAVLYAGTHVDVLGPADALGTTLRLGYGLVLGSVFVRWRSLRFCILLHIAINFLALGVDAAINLI